jgi:hypothetical protein
METKMKSQRNDNIRFNEPAYSSNNEEAAAQELNFNDEDEPSFQDFEPADEYELELIDEESTNATVDNSSTDDDLTPENLIPDDGSRSPRESGGSVPADEILSIVSEDEIGEGYGLDEAELARVDPLDGKPE